MGGTSYQFGGNLAQSSIVEVSEASDSQTFIPIQPENPSGVLYDNTVKKKRKTGSPV
jgi:hypothetical protein